MMLPFSHSRKSTCKPECGIAILEAYENCGEIDSNNQHIVAFFTSLCETNQNGDRCYEMYGSAREHYITEGACYIAYVTIGWCTCRARLSEVVDEQGCCLTAHQDFFTTVFPRYDPVALYNGCGVDRPEGCNNSPTDDSTISPVPNTQDCIEDDLDSASVDAACKLLDPTEVLNHATTLTQSEINIFFRELCKPECGTTNLEAYETCGEIDSNNQHIVDFFTSLCETSQNGDRCYEMYVSAREHYIAEGACYIGYTTIGLCACRAQLSEVVDEQGCCLIAHQDFFSTVFPGYDPVALYNGCGVDRPEECNNSHIDGSAITPVPNTKYCIEDELDSAGVDTACKLLDPTEVVNDATTLTQSN